MLFFLSIKGFFAFYFYPKSVANLIEWKSNLFSIYSINLIRLKSIEKSTVNIFGLRFKKTRCSISNSSTCRSIDGWKLFLRNAYWKNIREQLKEKFRAGSVASAALKTENFLSNAKKEDSTFNQYFTSSSY